MKTLQEVARETGIAYQTLKKHAQRGKLRTSMVGERIMVEDEDLEAYQLAEAVAATAKEVVGQPLEHVARDLGNVFAQIPPQLRDAILAGLPTTKSPGGPAKFNEARVAFPSAEPYVDIPESEDPHRGFPIGYEHSSSPRWMRVSQSTWKLGTRTYSWNGFGWEPGGTADKELSPGISPASPYADQRPLTPSHPVKTK